MTEKIKNLEKLAKRLFQALEKKERIVLYADSDLDGVSAIIILEEAISNLGGRVSKIWFSDRRAEEPGLNKEGLEKIKDRAPALLLLVDCGISNFEEAKLAKKLGFETAMLEHHAVLDKLPTASIIVNPKLGPKTSQFYDLASVGVAFKLAEVLLAGKMTRALRESFLELVALATIADMVPERGENKFFITEGLPLLETSLRPAVRVMFNSSIVHRCISTREKVEKLIPLINTTGKDGDKSELHIFLTAESQEKAKEYLDKFCRYGSERQEQIGQWMETLKSKVLLQKENIVFEGSSEIPQGLLGAVSSRLCSFFEKPVFLYKMTSQENIGHFRMPEKEDGIKALARCQKLLRRYGGHGRAGGFYFQEKDAKTLQQCLVKSFPKK